MLNKRMPMVDASRFSMVSRADVPRSTFTTQHTHKTTFHSGYLIPIEVAEVLPGDVHQGRVSIFARLATPVFPIMDNMPLETFFFFVPTRILWDNWVKMMGERTNPADSISYTIPQITPSGPEFGTHLQVATLYDYMGIPLQADLNATGVPGEFSFNALPFRAYNLIWNEWFRDQNLQNSLVVPTGNGPDAINDYLKRRRNKKHDYFTSALPWPLKGGTEISSPLAGQAVVRGIAMLNTEDPVNGAPANFTESSSAPFNHVPFWIGYKVTDGDGNIAFATKSTGASADNLDIYADLTSATGVTINALRLAIQTQRLLERDARSGTRYTELLRAHFGVDPEDTRLQRPEYIGGGRTTVNTQAIPQTSATGLTGGSTPIGSLGAAATASDQHQYSYHAKEHGYIIGLVHVTGDITYQQGIHRMWTRKTRYDFYWPVFAHLGEQIIRNDEIYARGNLAGDEGAFGYQERYAEYRHRPSRITGYFRSTQSGSIDQWHLSQEFGSMPTLNSTFIEDTPPFARVLNAGGAADNLQIYLDAYFQIKSTRPLPMYSVPGMMDHF